MMLTASEARRLFSYDPETGVLYWLVRPANCIHIGDVAGCVLTNKYGKHYIQLTIKQKRFYAHVVIWLIVTGAWPSGEIDHINGYGADNRLKNLRDVSSVENDRNQKMHVDNTSGKTGVFWHTRDKRWQAAITISGKIMYLGQFKEFNDAVTAREAAEKMYGFHPLHGTRLKPL